MKSVRQWILCQTTSVIHELHCFFLFIFTFMCSLFWQKRSKTMILLKSIYLLNFKKNVVVILISCIVFFTLFCFCQFFWCHIFLKMFTVWWLWIGNPSKSAVPLASGSFDAWSGSLAIWKMTSLLQNLKPVGTTFAESSGASFCSSCSSSSSDHQHRKRKTIPTHV